MNSEIFYGVAATVNNTKTRVHSVLKSSFNKRPLLQFKETGKQYLKTYSKTLSSFITEGATTLNLDKTNRLTAPKSLGVLYSTV